MMNFVEYVESVYGLNIEEYEKTFNRGDKLGVALNYYTLVKAQGKLAYKNGNTMEFIESSQRMLETEDYIYTLGGKDFVNYDEITSKMIATAMRYDPERDTPFEIGGNDDGSIQ